MVAVLTTDSDTYLMSEKEGPLYDELTVIGPGGAIDDVPGSDGTEIHRSHSARGEPPKVPRFWSKACR